MDESLKLLSLKMNNLNTRLFYEELINEQVKYYLWI